MSSVLFLLSPNDIVLFMIWYYSRNGIYSLDQKAVSSKGNREWSRNNPALIQEEPPEVSRGSAAGMGQENSPVFHWGLGRRCAHQLLSMTLFASLKSLQNKNKQLKFFQTMLKGKGRVSRTAHGTGEKNTQEKGYLKGPLRM